jgi:hypothetical protein
MTTFWVPVTENVDLQAMKYVVVRKARGWVVRVGDSKGTSEEDVLHIDVFACAVLQTTEETGGRDRTDGAGPGERNAYG